MQGEVIFQVVCKIVPLYVCTSCMQNCIQTLYLWRMAAEEKWKINQFYRSNGASCYIGQSLQVTGKVA